MKEEVLHEGVALLGQPFLSNIFSLSHKSTGCFVIYKAIMLLQLLNIQLLGIRHCFCLTSIAGIIVESQMFHLVFKFYFNLLT